MVLTVIIRDHEDAQPRAKRGLVYWLDDPPSGSASTILHLHERNLDATDSSPDIALHNRNHDTNSDREQHLVQPQAHGRDYSALSDLEREAVGGLIRLKYQYTDRAAQTQTPPAAPARAPSPVSRASSST